MRLKKYIAMITMMLVLCGVLSSDFFAAKANIGQFSSSESSASQRQAMPMSPPPSNYSSYSGAAPAARTSASAGTGIKIGSKYYRSLQDAVNSVKDGQTIHVTKNISLSKLIWCDRQINFTIDFHKHQVKMPRKAGTLYLNKGAVSVKNMKLTGVSDKMPISVGPESSLVIEGGSYNGQIGVKGNLTVKGGVFAGMTNYPTIFIYPTGKADIRGGTIKTRAKEKHPPAINNTGQCYISGGVITSRVTTDLGGSTTFSNGTIKTTYLSVECVEGNVEITGGSILSEEDCCVLIAGGTVNIHGGRFKGLPDLGGCVAVCEGGTLNISGGSFAGYSPWVGKYERGTCNFSGSASNIIVRRHRSELM